MEKRVLITRWLGIDSQPIPIYDEASVSSARQRVRETGQRLNFGKALVENVALIASELTHNQLSHARQGYFGVKTVERDGANGLEVIAADIGPGIEKPSLALIEKASPDRPSLGAGLSSACRIADEIEFDNRISEGLCVTARKFEARPQPLSCDAAIMGRPFPGELISGDDGVFLQFESGFISAVADGLGHGPEAREASNRAIETLIHLNRETDLIRIVSGINEQLAGTRGCAMTIVRFDNNDRTLECVSAGDVHAHLYHLREAHFLTAIPLVLGTGHFSPRRVRIEQTTIDPGTVLVMFTDGLKSRTTLKGQLDVLRQPPLLIAQHLLENHARPDDDALVLVARFLR